MYIIIENNLINFSYLKRIINYVYFELHCLINKIWAILVLKYIRLFIACIYRKFFFIFYLKWSMRTKVLNYIRKSHSYSVVELYSSKNSGLLPYTLYVLWIWQVPNFLRFHTFNMFFLINKLNVSSQLFSIW